MATTDTDAAPALTDAQLDQLKRTGRLTPEDQKAFTAALGATTAPATIPNRSTIPPPMRPAPATIPGADQPAPALPMGTIPAAAVRQPAQATIAPLPETGATGAPSLLGKTRLQGAEAKDLGQEGRPQVTAPPGTEAYGEQKQAQLDYDKAHPWGSAENHPGLGGKVAHVLSRIGNVAGDILAPREMALIPGTDLNRAEQAKGNATWTRLGAENDEKKAQAEAIKAGGELIPWKDPDTGENTLLNRKQWEALTAAEKRAGATENAAETRVGGAEAVADKNIAARAAAVAAKPPTSEQDKQFMASAEQQLDAGKISDADRTRLQGMQRAVKLTGLAPEIAAQIGNPPVPADFPGGTKDPAYIAANAKWGKDAEAIKNQEAGAMGAARGAGFNASKPLEVMDDQGNIRYMTAKEAEAQGVAGAGAGQKVIAKQAQFNDITNASSKVREAITAGGNLNFTPSQVAKLTLAMSEKDPEVMHNEISNLATSGLNEQQQNLVTWLQQLQERALSLRNIAGMGQGSETTRNAILKALPGITSGNQQMALKQLDAFDNMVKNLQQGVPKVKGGPERTGETGGGAGGGHSFTYNGQTYENVPDALYNKYKSKPGFKEQ